ncbi:MAG: phage tail assembly chaperone [Candidatus Hodarchaeales archaeon]
MIKKAKIITVEGTEFHIGTLSPLTAMAVLKKLTGIIGTAFSAEKQTEVFAALGPALNTLEDKDLNILWLQLFSCVQVVPAGKPPFQIDSEASFNSAFMGLDPDAIFIVGFDVMRHNRFPLVRDMEGDTGELMNGILTTPEVVETEEST